jgi:hypothetical protein
MVDSLLEAIRVATNADATPESRAAGATACRTLLAAFDTSAGQQIAAAPPVASQVAALIGALRGAPAEQLMDLAIAKLRAALPAGTVVPQTRPLKFQLIPVSQLAANRSER